MANKHIQHAIAALRSELCNYKDHLYRAKLALRNQSAEAPYGWSGRSLGDMIKGYQGRVDELKAAIKYMESLNES